MSRGAKETEEASMDLTGGWNVRWDAKAVSWFLTEPHRLMPFAPADSRSHGMSIAADKAGKPLEWRWNKEMTEGVGR